MLYPIEEYAWATAQVRQLEASRLRLLADARDGSERTLRSHLARKLVAAGLRLDRRAGEHARSASTKASVAPSNAASACCD